MQAFDILRVPIRRRILELLTNGERSSGELVTAIHDEFGVTQPAVSQHLRVLRESDFVTVHRIGTRRIYSIRAEPLLEIDAWLESFRGLWLESLDALDKEISLGKREGQTSEQSEAT